MKSSLSYISKDFLPNGPNGAQEGVSRLQQTRLSVVQALGRVPTPPEMVGLRGGGMFVSP